MIRTRTMCHMGIRLTPLTKADKCLRCRGNTGVFRSADCYACVRTKGYFRRDWRKR